MSDVERKFIAHITWSSYSVGCWRDICQDYQSLYAKTAKGQTN